MGMFDSFYDAQSNEWQTKAFERNLEVWGIGDTIPGDGAETYQVEVIGDHGGEFPWSLATIRGGVLTEVPAERDPRLPLVGYSGGVIEVPR